MNRLTPEEYEKYAAELLNKLNNEDIIKRVYRYIHMMWLRDATTNYQFSERSVHNESNEQSQSESLQNG